MQGDQLDVIDAFACEAITRSGGGTPPPPPPPPPPPAGAPTATLGAPAKVGLAKLLSEGIKLTLTCSEPATVKVKLVLSKKLSRKLGIGKRKTTVGSATGAAGPSGTTLKVKVARKYRKKLGKASKVVLTIALTATTTDGRGTTTSRTVTAKR